MRQKMRYFLMVKGKTPLSQLFNVCLREHSFAEPAIFAKHLYNKCMDMLYVLPIVIAYIFRNIEIN